MALNPNLLNIIMIWCLVLLFPVINAVKHEEFEVQRLLGERDRVTNLPGQPPVSFPHYAGYVPLPNSGKALFYWFFQAQENASRKPLVLWLNGGPGCSSVAYGAAQELGPFLVRSNGTLILNDFSWNKVANVLFLESPVGVGFSYTNNSKDLRTLGDRITAADSFSFLAEWFKRFPTFKSHDFYISGESYAGHYVPQLADLIYDRNNRTTGSSSPSDSSSFINLKGFMIGNAVINGPTDNSGMFDYAWSHAIISDTLYDNLVKKCDVVHDDNQTEECNDHIRAFLQNYSQIDIYGIYAPLCLTDPSPSTTTSPKPTRINNFMKNVAPRLLTQHELWQRLPSGYDPCTEDYVEQYFNRKDVQKALHANVTKLSYPYSPCSGVIKEWKDSPDTVLPIIQKLLKAGLRIWIYSGDTDGRVPVTSTRYSIKKMGLRVKQPWKAWFDKGQVAGWAETYEGGLTFATGVKLTLAKQPMFNRNPRQLRFEADMNRLFLYTSYNRFGRDADEADVDKIIDMANKASIADQQIQVQENIHLQIKNFCVSMDEVLLPNVKKINEGTESPKQSNAATRRSAFSFAIGRSGPPVKQHDLIGYTLGIKPSQIPHKEAGQGLFLNDECDVGAVVAVYPGVVYSPACDGTVINAQPWGYGGETRDFWDGLTVPETRPSKQRDDKPLDQRKLGKSGDVIERRNPLALAHFATIRQRICLQMVYIPNVIFGDAEEVKRKRFGSFWFKLGGSKNSGSDVPVLKSLVRWLQGHFVMKCRISLSKALTFNSILLLMRRKTEGGGANICCATQTQGARLHHRHDPLRQQKADQVTELPGQPPVSFKHYAGYVTVNHTHGRALFYWFFEATNNPQDKPLLLWLNGGPGCSSIGYGATEELGPFFPQNSTEPKLKFNPYTWNNAANLLFLESPVGVGFSYTNTSQDIEELDDKITAEDSYNFLINWFKRFPQYKSHDFYISGESYAGHYAPQLSELVFDRSKENHINLKGFMIGNAAIDDESDQKGLIDYAWDHAVISDRLYHDIQKECDFSQNISEQCNTLLEEYYNVYNIIDMYSLYTPTCLSNTSSSSSRQSHTIQGTPTLFSRAVSSSPLIITTHHDVRHKKPAGYDPCTSDYSYVYLNRPDVQKALHANVTKISYPWSHCKYHL
ncbi:unnamed protein product [Malus baccata var. baccata]